MTKAIKIALPIVVVTILAAVGLLGYRYYSSSEFNKLVTAVNSQYARGNKQYIDFVNLTDKMSAQFDAIQSSLDASSLDSDSVKQIESEIADSVSQYCQQVDEDLSSQTVHERVKHLWLTSSQKQYVETTAKNLDELEATDFSSQGGCRDGKLLQAYYQNIKAYLPGLVAYMQLLSDANTDGPTDKQVSILKKYTTASVIEEAMMQDGLPETTSAIRTINKMLATVYYYINAAMTGQRASAEKYASQLSKLGEAYQKSGKASGKETDSLAKNQSDKQISAAKRQIDFMQVVKKSDTELYEKLHYNAPAVWLIDGKITLYKIAHDDRYPRATSTNGLLKVLNDDYLNKVNDYGALSSLKYTSLGDDNTGFSITAKTADGKTLMYKQNPDS